MTEKLMTEPEEFSRIFGLMQEGEALSSSQVAELEQLLERMPGDVDSRCRLVGFYTRSNALNLDKFVQQLEWAICTEPATSSFLWWINIVPAATNLKQRSAVDYERIKLMWLAKTHNTHEGLLLLVAANFFVANRDLDLAKELLLRIATVDPDFGDLDAALETVEWLRKKGI